MKNNFNNTPQVNPPKMSSPDLSDAELEVREMIEEKENKTSMKAPNDNDPESKEEDSSFVMNNKKDE